MTCQSDFTADEWELILQAPAFTVLYVIQSENCNRDQAYQKMLAGISAIITPMTSAAGSDLVEAVRSAIETGQAPSYPKILPRDLIEARQLTTERCRQVVDLLAQRTPDHEATAFLAWLIAIGQVVAAAPEDTHSDIGSLATALSMN
jgi:hypothetical protein